MQIHNIDPHKLKPDPKQPRSHLDENKVNEIALSLMNSNVGIINPIEVDKYLNIITGHQRTEAAIRAGMETVPCKILDITLKDKYFRQVIENIHQNVMTDYDTAKALQKLLKSMGCNTPSSHPNDKGYRSLGRKIGKTHGWISKMVGILGESKEIQKAVKKGDISAEAIALANRAGEHAEVIKQKHIKGEFPTSDSVREITAALKRSPEKAEKLLNKDFSGLKSDDVAAEVRKISPSNGQLAYKALEESFDPGKRISEAVSELQALLERYPPHELPEQSKGLVIMALSGCLLSVKNYIQGNQKLSLTDENGHKSDQ